MDRTRTASQRSVNPGSPEVGLVEGTRARGQTQPLASSITTEIGIQAPSSTARGRVQTVNGASADGQQERSAFDITRIWSPESEVEVLFDKPLTVVTNQERTLLGRTQRTVPTPHQPIDDVALTLVFRTESATPHFDGNSTVRITPQSGPSNLGNTQLIRPPRLVDLDLAQIKHCAASDPSGKPQTVPPPARPDSNTSHPHASKPMLRPGAPLSGNTTPPPSLALGSLELGVTHILPVEALIARQNQVQNRSDYSRDAGAASEEPNRIEPLPRRVAESVIGRWKKLPRLTRGAFALALFGALLWGANAECGSRPALPVVALVAPIKPNVAVATDPAQDRKLGSNPATVNTAPLPPIDPRSTMERTAVDASVEGRYDVAIRLYDALASAHPDTPVYREAARILLARTQQR